MALLSHEIQEERHRVFLLCEVVNLHLPPASDPSPSTGQACVAEQRRFDRDRVKARHVSVRFGALDIDVVGLGDHNRRIGDFGLSVQREI